MDFWRLIWQECPQCVVMVTNLVEGGKTKCEQYWPSSGSQTFGPFTISVLSETTLPDVIIRTLKVSVSLVCVAETIITYWDTVFYCLSLYP